MEKTASKMFNTQMKVNNVMRDGQIVTSDYLSTLAQQDLPKAVELLSELYTKGQLSIQTLTKMFTSINVCSSWK